MICAASVSAIGTRNRSTCKYWLGSVRGSVRGSGIGWLQADEVGPAGQQPVGQVRPGRRRPGDLNDPAFGAQPFGHSQAVADLFGGWAADQPHDLAGPGRGGQDAVTGRSPGVAGADGQAGAGWLGQPGGEAG